MVTTPQEISIIDVVKGISMFARRSRIRSSHRREHDSTIPCVRTPTISSPRRWERLAQEVGAYFFG